MFGIHFWELRLFDAGGFTDLPTINKKRPVSKDNDSCKDFVTTVEGRTVSGSDS